MEELPEEAKEFKMTGHYFPSEILSEIFQYLNAQELSKVASMNRLWNEAANHELTKRGLQRILIFFPNTNVHNSMWVKPYVTFMFIAPEIKYISKYLQRGALEEYKNRIPHYLVTVGAHRLMMDEKLVTFDHEFFEGEILSLLIPENRNLKIRAAYNQDLSRIKNLKDFLNEFLPEDSKSKATFLIFGQSMFDNSHLFELLQESMEERQQKCNMWGAAFADAPFAAINGEIDKNAVEEFEEYDEDFGATEYNGMFAMSITGSSFESSSTVISCITRKREFEQKLLDFRDQVHFKRHSVGLACGPNEVFDRVDLMDMYTTFPDMLHVVKRVFPNVPFIGLYNEGSIGSYYGLKSETDDPEQKLQHQQSLSLMILTYD